MGSTHEYRRSLSFRSYKAMFFTLMQAATSLLALASCEETPFKEVGSSTREFLISAGEHYSTPALIETTEAKKVTFRATFDESARYVLSDASVQSNINKLMGISDCNSHHHENSARFGWRWFENKLEILAYCYVDSLRMHEHVGIVNINEENLYEITVTADAYQFSLNGEDKVSIPRTRVCNEGINYMLYPYFGGSVPAPHDVRIKIQMLD